MSQALEPLPVTADIPPNPRGPKRKYSERQKAQTLAILAVNQGNLSATVRATGIPIRTIADWRDQLQGDPQLADNQRGVNTDLVGKLEDLAHRLADAAPGKISKAALAGTVNSLGVVIDKMQLLKGLPTSITEERIEGRAVLVLMSNALGLEDPAGQAIDITPEPGVTEKA